jgi:hypothetical protein
VADIHGSDSGGPHATRLRDEMETHPTGGVMPKHRDTFSSAEWAALRVLVEHLRRAPKEEQELIRGGMRGLGFYISDFEKAENRFVPSDLDRLVQQGRVKIAA